MLKAHIRYIDPLIEKVSKIEKGDAIDLRASSISYIDPWDGKKVKFAFGVLGNHEPFRYWPGLKFMIHLGFAMKLPYGYSALVFPRSSTNKNFKLQQTNSLGLIDFAYAGNNDEWGMPVIADDYGVLNHNDRVCQFVIHQFPEFIIKEVDELYSIDRGGFGSTGVK